MVSKGKGRQAEAGYWALKSLASTPVDPTLEFGASADDVALTIDAHPTLSESVGMAGELAAGTITDLPNPQASRR
ncbi:hypothetical protein [Mangrovitalea sediminis]|uniref:hypothetical protein n=1 Tax=Mangrovitalea sediminis TaxID=1982043 RepID=UPI000BE59EFF|nr:hypothetical protein [Mangrovitalea sediminis]